MIPLHRCEDGIRADRGNDADCLAQLEHSFAVGKVLGHGVMGLVLHITARVGAARSYAVKMVPRDEQTRRVERELGARSEFFARMYGWIKCGRPPLGWQRQIDRYAAADAELTRRLQRQRDLYYIVSELGDVSMDDYPYSLGYELRSVVFEVVYALWTAYGESAFQHGDLHMGNVVLVKRGPRTYNVGQLTFETLFLYQPKLIDFDHATFGEPIDDDDNDVITFIGAILSDMSRSNASLREFIVYELKPYYERNMTAGDLLRSGLFEELRTEAPSPVKRVKCHVCGAPAVSALESEPSFAFCGFECVRDMGPLVYFL